MTFQKIEIPKLHWDLYDDETPIAIARFFEKQIYIIENLEKIPILFQAYKKWRIHYGDRHTGCSWNTTDAGYIGIGDATEQEQTVLSLFKTPKSKSGKQIMVRCVVKIESVDTDAVEYRHPNFHVPEEKVMERPEEQKEISNCNAVRRNRGIAITRN